MSRGLNQQTYKQFNCCSEEIEIERDRHREVEGHALSYIPAAYAQNGM